MPIISDTGFRPSDGHPLVDSTQLAQTNVPKVDVAVANDADPADLLPHFARLRTIAIPFPSFADGRGFSLARRFRDLGYKGCLRASGHILSDQYDFARASGFDEVEIDEDLAARQPEELWVKPTRASYRQKILEKPRLPANAHGVTVKAVTHYTDRLFSFRVSRPSSFRFRSGEFCMIGLPGGKPVFRAYSVASPSWDDELEFYSIKVPGGPLTEELQKIQEGDTIWLRQKVTGTLVADALLPKKRLYLFSTGTGIAPFASLIRDPEVYEKFGQVVLIQTSREVAELTYGTELVAETRADPLVGDYATPERLVHIASATRETFTETRRITDLITSGDLFKKLGVDGFDPERDAGMICGSMDMLKEVKGMLEGAGLIEGTHSKPGDFTVERAFVD